MGQEDNITKIASNGWGVTQEGGKKNKIGEMIEKSQDKTREVVEQFFSDGVMTDYYEGVKGKKLEEKKDRIKSYKKEIQNLLKNNKTDLDDKEEVKEAILGFLKKKRAVAVMGLIEKNMEFTQGKTSENEGLPKGMTKGTQKRKSESKGETTKERKTEKEKREEMQKRFVKFFGEPENGDFYSDKGGVVFKNRKHELRIILVKRSDIERVCVFDVKENEFLISDEDKDSERSRTEFDFQVVREIIRESGYKFVNKKVIRKEDGKRKKNVREINKAPTLKEFYGKYHKNTEGTGRYIHEEDGSELEIIWYSEKEGVVTVIYPHGMKEKEKEIEKDGIPVSSYDMPKRDGEKTEEPEKILFSEFEEIINKYNYVSGNEEPTEDTEDTEVEKKEGNLEDGIESVIKAGEDDDPLNETVAKERPVEINKGSLNSEIKTKEQFEKEFYPGQKVEMYKTNSMFKIGRLEFDENNQELRVFITLRRNGKKIGDKQISVEEFGKIYNKWKGRAVDKGVEEIDGTGDEKKENKLGDEIKTVEEFRKHFYPIGTTIENQFRNFFIKILDIRTNKDDFLEIKVSKGKRKDEKKNYKIITEWLSVDEFSKVYDKENIIWEVKGNNKKQTIEISEGDSNEEDKDEKEKKIEFTEEEKGYIDDFTEYVEGYLEELEEYLKGLGKKKYSDSTIKGIRDDETRHLLEENLKTIIANYGVFSKDRVADVVESIKKELE